MAGDAPAPKAKKVGKFKGPVFGKPKPDGEGGAALQVPRIHIPDELLKRNKVGRPTKYDPSTMLDIVYEVGSKGGSIGQMAVALGVSLDSMYTWAKQHDEFAEALKRSVELSQCWWEENGRIATFGGFEGFNATSYIFQMKNRFPRAWRDAKQTEITGEGGGAVQVETVTIDARKMDPSQREILKQALLIAQRDVEGDDT
jgi:transposase-like protein